MWRWQEFVWFLEIIMTRTKIQTQNYRPLIRIKDSFCTYLRKNIVWTYLELIKKCFYTLLSVLPTSKRTIMASWAQFSLRLVRFLSRSSEHLWRKDFFSYQEKKIVWTYPELIKGFGMHARTPKEGGRVWQMLLAHMNIGRYYILESFPSKSVLRLVCTLKKV